MKMIVLLSLYCSYTWASLDVSITTLLSQGQVLFASKVKTRKPSMRRSTIQNWLIFGFYDTLSTYLKISKLVFSIHRSGRLLFFAESKNRENFVFSKNNSRSEQWIENTSLRILRYVDKVS